MDKQNLSAGLLDRGVDPLEEEGKRLAAKYGSEWISCSAYTGEGVNKVFETICRKILEIKEAKLGLHNNANA